TSHLVRYVSKHPVPRVLPSPRLPAFRVARVVAYTRLLRVHCCALSPRTRHSGETPVLGSSAWRALADRLAANQSWSVTYRQNVGAQRNRLLELLGYFDGCPVEFFRPLRPVLLDYLDQSRNIREVRIPCFLS